MTHSRHLLSMATAALLILAGGLGCKKPKTKPQDEKNKGLTATDLITKGELQLKRRKWEDGRRTLRFLEENLPGSKEFPKAKLLLGDSFFFGSTSSYPEAIVEYQGFLNYFPRHEQRDYALYRIAMCHFASIESAERDQTETKKALESFNQLLLEHPGSVYAVDAKAKVVQCWRRLAESELITGIFYVNSFHYVGAEKRLKNLMNTYPEYVDRERAYYYLGEAMRRKQLESTLIENFVKEFLARTQKEDFSKLSKEEVVNYKAEFQKLRTEEEAKYREEAKGYFQKLVESYPKSEWAGRARDRLLEMGQAGLKEELDG